ncbi:MAG TPA: uracil-DNA glycosylase [Candidatus Binatia bacterium]|nr:uracil-DNA glycosylase [Candidatus Binatia bacterium]
MASDSAREFLLQLTESVRRYVESLQEGGVAGLPSARARGHGDTETRRHGDTEKSEYGKSSSAPRVPESPSPRVPSPAASRPQPPVQPIVAPAVATQAGDLFLSPTVQTVQTLEELRAEIGDCRRCKLCQGRTKIVFGVGNPRADLVFVGEGPGRDEDLKGEPFVGRAGQLLTEIITKGMKLRREDVYIANVVKCRPPDNRNPEPDEIAACEPFLMKQLDLIKPRLIVALGTFAAQTLLKTKTPISRLRGVWHTYQGVKLMPTLHPAYLLRNPNDKRLVWQDIQAVLREMGRL